MRKIARLLIAGSLVVPALFAQGAHAAPIARSDQPAVITGASVPGLQGLAASDIVGFRYNGGWQQIPIQTDEVKMFNITKAYPSVVGPCSDPCYSWSGRTWYKRVYADPNTLTGAEVTELVNGVQNKAGFDADDEIALMVKDAGDVAPSGAGNPADVVGNGFEVKINDPLNGGVGFVYLFERAGATLDASAGTSYVSYKWVVNHIASAHPGDPQATQNFYATEYRFTGYNGTTSGAGNPETSSVTTAHYRREMTGRWTDNVMKITRGGSTGQNMLDRHDESISFDAGCARYQGTFDKGEMTYITSKGGPIRAIRHFLGTNSGPLTERQDIFYESSTAQRIDLRVHPIPGATEYFAYNANAVGLRYSESSLGTARIDGIPDAYTGIPAILPNSYVWETVDKDTLTALPGDPAPAGALTFVNYFNTNNPDPIAHGVWHDGGNGGCANRPYYGTAMAQAPLALVSTDVSGSTQSTFLEISRNIHYEAPGTANGPVRMAQDTTPLAFTAFAR